MTIELMPLPYSAEALEPHVSSETINFHYGKHHRGYVSKVNQAIEGTALADANLESIITSALEKGNMGLFNSAAQTWNHGFYWHSLSPESQQPSGPLAEAITRDFGSLEQLNEQLAAKATGHFASGWAWLVSDGGTLKICSTHDAESPITDGLNPLLTIDVWEHAYYIDQRNDRAAYVKALIDNCLNWEFASANYERGSAWSYTA